MSTFPARYPGRCGACDERIYEGDQIRFDADSTVIHGDCTEHEPKPVRENPVCTTCWLAHPVGACDR